MDRSFNGHKNYNYWNVFTNLADDNGDNYFRVVQAIRSLQDKDKAARYLLAQLPPTTPEHVRYTFRNIREALKHFNV